jgi:branched-chain amino acid transport system substrate-binding protein
MQPNNLQMGAIMGQYAIKNGFKTFGVMYNQSNAYAVSLLEPFTKAVSAAGGTVVKEVAYTANDKDYKTLLSPLVSAKVDAIYMPNYTQDLILITQQARGLGYEGALIAGLDAGPPFNTMLGEDCDKIYYINNVDDTEPKLKDMIKAVKEKAGIDATNKFFLGYDIAGILNQVLAETGPDPDKIHDAMLKVKDYDGLTGKITIDPATHMPTGLEMVMFTYKGTTPVMLERYSAK